MNYIGSKIKLLPFIEKSILSVIDKDCKVFCDLFAGTGTVGSHFKKLGYKIISNDLQYYSYVLNKQLIDNHKELEFCKLEEELPELRKISKFERKIFVCKYLSNLKEFKGFIYKNYSPSKTSERMYLTSRNAQKCDAIRKQIENWKNLDLINYNEYYFLLASLIKSVDKHANVLSVYGAYLKYFKNIALKNLIIEPCELIKNDKSHKVYNQDANKLIRTISSDILYLDPPYNSRQYATNYHLLETIAKYDNPKIHGKTGLREYKEQKSLYCLKTFATETLKDLIKNANTKYIFLSYSNEGIISKDDIKNILENKGEYGCFEIKHNRYKSDSNRTYKANHTIEYLHYCKCNLA
ncbi:DNA adenine methylase [Aliarcobacter butzleri]|uniref:DNA adenine methylase n=1 Tax=Aliarcobacter butzleri TaxID=28197 RepID=UPI001EDD56B5|nr:DNA adenine methylase [Aliarcobacter butzleri]MCG3669081.1 DNA adenine methylase [Aliarcobacter butzleri]